MSEAPTEDPKRTALLIANHGYASRGLAELSVPPAEVHELADALRRRALGGFDRVELIEDADKPVVYAAVDTLCRRSVRDELLLIYASGVCLSDGRRKLHLLTVNSRLEPSLVTAVSVSYLLRAMNRAAAQRQVLILDCVQGALLERDGPMLGSALPGRSLFAPDAGLRAVVLSSRVLQLGWNGEQWLAECDRSRLTRLFVDGMVSGDAAPDSVEIDLRDLYWWSTSRLAQRQPGLLPELMILGRDNVPLVLARNPAEAGGAPALPASLVRDLCSRDPRVWGPALNRLGCLVQAADGAERGRLVDALDGMRDRIADSVLGDAIDELIRTFVSPREGQATAGQASVRVPAGGARAGVLEGLAGSNGWGRWLLIFGVALALVLLFRRTETDADAELASLLTKAEGLLEGPALAAPGVDHAYAALRQVRLRAPNSDRLAAGLARVADWYLARAEEHIRVAHFELARVYLAAAAGTGARDAEVAKLRRRLPAAGPSAGATAPERLRDRLIDGGLGLELVALPGGCFTMGSPIHEPGRDPDERAHRVCVESFAIGSTEVRVGDYARFARAVGRALPRPQAGRDGTWPVTQVSWHDAMAYAAWLSDQTGRVYRLPDEAEWELAARAGTREPYWLGPCVPGGSVNFDGQLGAGVCSGKALAGPGRPVATASLPANPWGLHEVLGNVWEWTCCGYDADYGGGERRCLGPQDQVTPRVIRGGAFDVGAAAIRAANRAALPPHSRVGGIGFRLLRELEADWKDRLILSGGWHSAP